MGRRDPKGYRKKEEEGPTGVSTAGEWVGKGILQCGGELKRGERREVAGTEGKGYKKGEKSTK